MNAGRLNAVIKLIISVCSVEFLIIPAIVPVPIKSAQTPIIFEKP